MTIIFLASGVGISNSSYLNSLFPQPGQLRLYPDQQENPNLFRIARLKYHGGGDWYNDPSILPNILEELHQRTGTPVDKKEKVLEILDPDLFQYPVLFMTGHGNIIFSPAEVERLREYFLRGGFLYADDDYGMDQSFRREIKKVFPDQNLVELPFNHPIYHIFYDFPQGPPKIHEHDNKPPQCFALFVEGRLVVLYSYETNFSDGWASPEVHQDPPEIREAAIKIGINIFLYVLTH